ncbi:composite domain of metallo-dependent hydrolase [Pluteus cervinus]|uniref:Composite domain of metallo-dependent hydrolase n=1 Tax=Pluteus cervinus TaxID=181527 RepID=A0ACD3BCI7_9AGAR|nr:composite domain of metallo-dependent hydrolase [Pluteus cervinus]
MSSKFWATEVAPNPRRSSKVFSFFAIFVSSAALSVLIFLSIGSYPLPTRVQIQRIPINAESILAQCAAISEEPGPSFDFSDREKSDRFEEGTPATLIRNARIFTGEKNGSIELHGDIFLDNGIIKGVGRVPRHLYANRDDVVKINANGRWVTPGLIDLNSHLGVLSSPITRGTGADDVDSNKGPILPWLRTVDGLNTHDDGYELAISGGVTSAQVLPGNKNAIGLQAYDTFAGGQSFFMKMRKTAARTPVSMLIEPPNELTGIAHKRQRWRHMKHTCGERLRNYGNRMDHAWSFRAAYESARSIKEAQDDYCLKAQAGLWESLGGFPKNLQWESLVDVLRGRVKISAQCDEAVDLDTMVRLSQEFQFPIASFHAAEAWLVPDLLKQTYEGIPAVALFATNYRTRRETFRGSEFAPRILADAGIHVVMKTDHPVINSRYLVYEAQQAHHFGLPASLALASVTSTPAAAAGLAHRIGSLTVGADADVVLWDSHPLQLSATPIHVWIDGIMQIPVPAKGDEDNEVEVGKGKEGERWLEPPEVPNWDKERKEAQLWDGLPPLKGKRYSDRVVFRNVKDIWKVGQTGVTRTLVIEEEPDQLGDVVVEGGRIICSGSTVCAQHLQKAKVVDLEGGSLMPGLMTYGSPLGLEEIAAEPSTGDGKLYDAFVQDIPEVFHDVGNTLRAVDALAFGTRNALLAYRSGVTMATSSLNKGDFVISGLSVTFGTGSSYVVEHGAILQEITALHVKISRPNPLEGTPGVSVSSQIGGLRRLLFGWESRDQETGHWFRKAAEGVVPLVIEVYSADIMGSLLMVKAEVEDRIGSYMRVVFAGATEAHLIAKDIASGGVGVILIPARPYPHTWQERRILPGPPLTNDTALVTLIENNVKVGIGIPNAWEARNTKMDMQWAKLESNGRINEHQVLMMVTGDLEDLLGIREIDDSARDLVAYAGGNVFDPTSKVVAGSATLHASTPRSCQTYG